MPMIAFFMTEGYDVQSLLRELTARPSRTLLGFSSIPYNQQTLKPWVYWRRIARTRAKNKIVVITQTSAAFLQNALNQRQRPLNFLNKIFSGGTPRPDLFFVIMKNAQDHEGLAVIERLSGACILDGSKSPQELADIVLLEIHKLLKARTSESYVL